MDATVVPDCVANLDFVIVENEPKAQCTVGPIRVNPQLRMLTKD